MTSYGPTTTTDEVLEAMDEPEAHRRELGDLLLQIVFQAALREREGLVYEVSVSSLEGRDVGHVLVHASTSQDKLARAQAAMVRVLRRHEPRPDWQATYERKFRRFKRHIEVLGALPDYITGTGFHVSPVVGLVRDGFIPVVIGPVLLNQKRGNVPPLLEYGGPTVLVRW